MSGGKGGSQTTTVEIPKWLEEPAKQNIAKAEELAKIGYTPYYGPDVAAMTPSQLAAGQNIMGAAQAFGMAAPTSATAGMPQATDYGGMGAYSSAPLYEQALGELATRAPAQMAALQAPFINPVTGAQPGAPFGSGDAAPQPVTGGSMTGTPMFDAASMISQGSSPQAAAITALVNPRNSMGGGK